MYILKENYVGWFCHSEIKMTIIYCTHKNVLMCMSFKYLVVAHFTVADEGALGLADNQLSPWVSQLL